MPTANVPLPQRPSYAVVYPPGPSPGASTLEDLVASASRQGGDDIDQLIRMAERGIKPPRRDNAEGTPPAAPAASAPAAAPATAAAPPQRPAAEKTKKEKGTRMIYSDGELQPRGKDGPDA